MRTHTLALLAIIVAAPAAAETEWRYRVRFTAEHTETAVNRASPLAAASSGAWNGGELVLASADATWASADRWQIGAAVDGSRAGGDVKGGIREGYVRLSATSWMDLEAGKRIVRWGVAYGFSPAGVLDPPRRATDPSDRLQRNEGQLMTKATLYRGAQSLTLAVAERRAAVRLEGMLPRGVAVAVIATAGTRPPQYGGTITHVIGRRLESHAEALVHEGDGRRAVSVAAGAQYTFPAGLNLIVEYHRNGHGLDADEWRAVRSGRNLPSAQPSRRNFLFLRAARTGGEVKVMPELIVIRGLDDNGWTLVPSITWTPHRRVGAYVRIMHLHGSAASVVGLAPFSTAVTAGTFVAF